MRRSPSLLLSLAAFAALAFIATGCHGSRWAKRDADYRQKYPHHTGNVAKTVKQAIDARHVRGKRGGYVAFAGRSEPFAGGGEIGGFMYGEPWIEGRMGLAGLIHETGDHPISGGLITSVRMQVPARLAPFVGGGLYGGWAGQKSAEHDGIDNDGNGFIDELGEDENDFAIAIFPEVGAHFWINHRLRITTSATYYITNQGRDDDFLFYSIGLSFFGREYEKEPHCPRVDAPTADDWQFTPMPPKPLPPGTNLSPYAGLDTGGPEADNPETQQPHEVLPSTQLPDTLPLPIAPAPTNRPNQQQVPTGKSLQLDIPINPILNVQRFDEDYPTTATESEEPTLGIERVE